MLADSRSRALVTNFTGQWLYLRNIAIAPVDTYAFPDFDDNLRQAFARELELFLDSQFRQDHPAADLLDADYTFVNERLARHYGIPNIYGSHFLPRARLWPMCPMARSAGACSVRARTHGDFLCGSHLSREAR